MPNLAVFRKSFVWEEEGSPLEVPQIEVPLPWEAHHAVTEELPEIEGRVQWSIREDTGDIEIERPPYEHTGWTVEWRSPVKCEWADFWITATAWKHPMVLDDLGTRVRKVPLADPVRFPAVNMDLHEALRCAREMRDGQRVARQVGSDVIPMSMVRIRHQTTSNVLYADIL
jgi:hypothetical protein